MSPELWQDNENQNEKERTKIDIEDIKKVKKYKWYLSNNNYVNHDENGFRTSLHRLIMDCPENKQVDHINGDTLDNRKSNLRIVNNRQNTVNSKYRSNFYSEDVGVRKKDNGKWVSKIKYKYKTIYLGTFKNKNKAIEKRREAEVKYFGKYIYNYEDLKKKGMIR